MRAWTSPEIPSLPATAPAVRLYDTATDARIVSEPDGADGSGGAARLYVCGITPYDATHLGHAATYVGFDLLLRAWRNAGHDVTYVQNVTDVDDPLLERATKVNVDWVALAERETELFRQDMTALRVIAPDHYVGAVESIPLVIEMIEVLQAAGSVYAVEQDLYYSVSADEAFGEESRYSRDEMLALFGERGGDPERPGKRDPLDCVVWRGERAGEPSWPSPFGPGRPGWHIECAAIAQRHLGSAFEVQGGGSDLRFPHHEMCAGHAQVARPGQPFAQVYSHAGMVGYDGEKMSKSKGNLGSSSPRCATATSTRWPSGWPCCATTSAATGSGPTPSSSRPWTPSTTGARRSRWAAGAPAEPVVADVLAALSDDLDAPRALGSIDAWVAATLGTDGLADTSDPDAAASIVAVLDAALGVAL